MSSTSADIEFWIRLVKSSNSRIQVILYQEDDPELDYDWLTADEKLTSFRKDREKIVVRVKGSELSSIQGPQYSEEYTAVRERVPRSTERISATSNCPF